ncbi:MAG: T9SS C-terminal target domain-containing protein [Winogradskyella sp.]|uniref:T9SS type A sorting domain-containing protein n=1 Tax=Winogradskyella sp. TaxID=1883156 RepID=UPI000F40F4B0|nr:T9SS type A sorting domain-containing protein [Winogradskyella sp.]RNC86805.1 MAG: T9SS C-terminal target domain-containing protein [Winogradskyella sp.]
MKSYTLLLLFFLSASQLLRSQTTVIPDVNFEDYLETHTPDGVVVNVGDPESMGDGIANNSLVLTDRISGVTSLNLIDLNIADLSGIADFNSLEILVCADNRLSSIDISSNVNLTLLNVSNNRIVGNLAVNTNTNLESLFCSSNQISSLDLSQNIVLKNLDASNNMLIDLDLSTINTVICPNPQTNPETACQGTASINVARNQLTSLIVANGYNDLISTFDATENPDLFCIQIDGGFTPNGWNKDDWAYYSDTTCVDIFTYVPDDNFEQALIDLGLDDVLDNLVLRDNINPVTNLDVSNQGITSLLGIEDFSALVVFNCSNNSSTSIDLSANSLLEELYVSNNNLSALDISSNTAITVLNCSSNMIGSIDLSNNLSLQTLDCSNNSLQNIIVSNNTALDNLNCAFNQIESLNLVSNTSLTNIVCNDNSLFSLNLVNGTNNLITALNATNNPDLSCIQVDDVAFSNAAPGWQKDITANYNLDCGTYIPDDNFEQALIDLGIDSDGTLNNFVPTIDISGILVLDISNLAIQDLTGIEDFGLLDNLNCSNNLLSSLDLSFNNALTILDCSNNQINDLNLTTNAALTSLLVNDNTLQTLNIDNGNNALLTTFNATNNSTLFCINVDATIVANIPVSWQKDAIATYNGDCANNRFTLIPDTFFEQALIDLGYDTVIDGQVLTANIELVQSLNISSKSISDVTGIQDFKLLEELDCSGNFLDALDVSNMQQLARLNCSSNYLQTNDINNSLGLFNTTGTLNLTELFCADNQLNDLDVSTNNSLQILDCANNNLSLLNVSGNTQLIDLNCSNNALTTLDVSSNSVLQTINCDSNLLNNLVTIGSNNTTLTNLSCVNNNLTQLLVNNYQVLETLNCGSNALAQIDVSSNIALSFLSASNNELSNLSVINNTNLEELYVSQNSLAQLDISANAALEVLNCNLNVLTALHTNSNSQLKLLSCSSNQLTTLELINTTGLIELDANSNMLTSIMLSNNLGALKTFNVSNNLIEDDIDLSTMAISACVFQPNQTEICPEIISINVSNNLLDFVNIQNGINQDIISFNASNNPNLDCIQVDDAANVSPNWLKDATTDYSTDCNFGETFVPDDNFEQALINLGLDSGPLNDFVLTSSIELLTSLDISGNNISDLTGLEDFEALQDFNCSNNAISSIDLSSNINLVALNCSNNQLSDLDISNNTLLTTIICSNNTLSSLDAAFNASLTELDISNNMFASFIPSNILTLQVFNCDNNDIVELDFQQNTALIDLTCQFNQLETLNLQNGQNTILVDLNASNNLDLICIQTDTGTVPAGANWVIDATSQFATECFFGQTFIPDDNFEQALIDLGLDTVLDDYVITDNIDDISFLNLNSREISDVTGIEDFIGLTSLNVEINTISTIDLSTNLNLTILDVSDNILTDLDISNLINLNTLDTSNNELANLDLSQNLSITDLDISNNMITNLDVSLLLDLNLLDCSNNLIEGLDFTQNVNLNFLYVQANTLINDQLNVQNGNNETIQIFNATNNPDLGCILVDNPVAVITNADGTYDNWTKDDSASYQTICLDADNDGVPNTDDACPGTAFGATVDLFGCPLVDLAEDNFLITITGETCLNSNDGKIRIEAQIGYNYTATLSNDDFYQDYNFTNNVDIFNLLAGTYTMCITIEEFPDYELCYTIVITEPNPLEVFASRIATTNRLSVDMNGSTRYNVVFNNDSFFTYNSNLELDLQQGINTLKITADSECQGIYEETFVLNDFLIYPIPFSQHINIYNGLENEELEVKMYSSLGRVVYAKTFFNQNSGCVIDTKALPPGMYIITINSKSISVTDKIIKQ